MTPEELKKKKEQRAGIVTQMRALLDTAEKAKRDLTADEQTTYANLEKDLDTIGAAVDREERLSVVENNLRGRRDHNYRPGVDDPSDLAVKNEGRPRRFSDDYRSKLFNARQSYARVGRTSLSGEYVNVLNTGVDSEGGYLVPEEFETRVIENLVNADPIRAGATVITTGSDRHIPIESDEGTFGYVDENAAYGISDPAFGRITLAAHKCGGIVKVSDELLQDNFFNLEAYLNGLASRRYSILEQVSFATGNGTGKPLGLFATTTVAGAALTGITGAVSATPIITTDNLLDTFHALARVYRQNAAWITSDAEVKAIRKLKDDNGQYLWQPGLQAGQPDRLLNRPVLVSDGAPAPAAGGKGIMFGDLSYYYIADRLGITLKHLGELYAANGQVGFRFTRRHDGKLVSAKAFTFFQHGAAS